MDKKFKVEIGANASETKIGLVSQIQITNDNLVNDFINKNISLESLIEKEIYN